MRQRIALSHNRSLIACYSKARLKSRTWLVFLTESGADFQPANRTQLGRFLLPDLVPHFHYLVINKPGLHPKGRNRTEFEASFRRELRVQDALQAMKEIIPRHHQIYLVGYSEGAYLAPQVALGDRRVKSVSLIGGGTRGWLKEELSQVRQLRQKMALRQQIAQILRQPVAHQRWNGFSYATWHSYRDDDTLIALERLRQVPVLAILGEQDRVIDFKAALRDLRRLSRARRPVHVEVLPGLGHELASEWALIAPLLSQPAYALLD